MTDHDHISDLRWDQLLAGELSADKRSAIDAHVATCSACAARRREIEAFAETPLPALATPKRSRWWLGAPVAALAAAAVAVIVLRAPSEPSERPKGSGPALILAAGSPSSLVPVSTNDVIHAGDSLQAGYTSTKDGFGAVLSLDGAGTVSAYVPAVGDALVALPAGTERSFPGSTVLDEVLGPERIAIIWCAAPQPIAPLLAELKATQQLSVREGCAVRLVTLVKK